MNERIRQLAVQAFFDETTSQPSDKMYTFSDHKMEKFAQLIVEECMLCCERVISDPVPKSVDTWLNGGKQCIDEIKYHFGVE